MRPLSGVVAHSMEETVCAIDLGRSGLFAEADGSVPAFVSLEYMAQCAAVHARLVSRSGGEPPRAAFLLGTRRLWLGSGRFRPGQRLRVSARHHRGASGLVVFDCALNDADSEEALAEGQLNLYIAVDEVPLGEPPA
jgi:predicted hotdog family 3-hydroxylacyl-ACP dehydratase